MNATHNQRHMKTLTGILLVMLSFSTHAQFIEHEDRDKRYPVPAAWDRRSPHKIGMFTHMGEITRTCVVAKSSQPVPLQRAPRDLSDVKYKADANFTLKEHLEKNYVMGLTFVRDGKIVDQHFQYERRADDLFTSFSAGKSIISVLIGIALDEGLIKSLDDPVSKYTNRINDSSYSKVKVRSLLRMSSGIPFDESGDGYHDGYKFDYAVRMVSDSSVVEELNKRRGDIYNEGSKFNYASIETAVLAEVLRGATGQNICKYAQEKLWEPIGAEFDARMETDGQGNVIGYSGFNAAQTDYAKVGVMLANNGEINGKRVLSTEYINQATKIEQQPEGFRIGQATRSTGYGYQFWLLRKPGLYFMMGSYGQYVVIDRDTKSVFVVNTADPVRISGTYAFRTFRLFQSLIDATN